VNVRIGGYAIQALVEASFRLDGGAMFGVVPRPLWQRDHPPDADNRIALVCRCLLLRGHGHVVLLDTGIGDRWDDAHRQRHAIERDRGLPGLLAPLGITPEEVTDVIQTHLHFDHAGGLSRLDGDTLAPTFPRATLHVQRRNWDWARAPSPRDAGSYRPADWLPYERGDAPLRLLRGAETVVQGIEAIETDGHTVGHQVIRLRGMGDEPDMVYCGDLFPTRSHLPLPWTMAYDLFPLQTMEAKQRLLEESHERGTWLVLEHDPEVDAVRASFDGRRASARETVTLDDEDATS
jgi:glyoxylase-like metal-dependent hydrolase (beta-lactamase superfamily II)